jgi:hypothetical protein
MPYGNCGLFLYIDPFVPHGVTRFNERIQIVIELGSWLAQA